MARGGAHRRRGARASAALRLCGTAVALAFGFGCAGEAEDPAVIHAGWGGTPLDASLGEEDSGWLPERAADSGDSGRDFLGFDASGADRGGWGSDTWALDAGELDAAADSDGDPDADRADPDAEDPDPDTSGPDADADVGEPAGLPELLPPPAPDLTEVAPGLTAHDVAAAFAPAWHHDTANGGPDGIGAKADYPIRYDYDGDLQHNDNWDDLPSHPAYAHIYYALVASETHWFLTYSQYHPRDWEQICTGLFTECHEGDMESVRMVVEREELGLGTLVMLETSAHGSTHHWAQPGAKVAKGPAGGFDGGVDFEDAVGGYSPVQTETHTHPRIFVQAKGHGPIACTAGPAGLFDIGFIEGVSCNGQAPYDKGFAGGDGIVFRLATGEPQLYDPSMPKGAQWASYGLVSYRDSLLAHRYNVGSGKLFRTSTAFKYKGARGFPFQSKQALGASFDSKQFINDLSGGSAGWNEKIAGSEKGDVFFDPAWAFGKGFAFSGEWSVVYTFNPYVHPAVDL